jgi:thioesterase domain-containing protein
MNLQDERVATSQTWSSLVAIQPGRSRPPFFWIHGENSTVFLPRFLDPDQPIYGVFHQSRDGTRARYTTVEAIAAHYLSEMRTAQPEGPYYLGGFCIGGTIALEIAGALRTNGDEVGLVILVDPVTPGGVFWKRPSRKPASEIPLSSNSSMADRVGRFFEKVASVGPGGKVRLILGTTVEKAGMLPAAGARAAVAAAASLAAAAGYPKKLGATAAKFAKRMAGKLYYRTGIEPIPAKLVTFYLDAVYSQAMRDYEGRRYDGEIVILGTQDALFDPRGFEKFTGGLKVIEIPANHDHVMYYGDQIQLVAEKIKFYLEQAQARRSAAGA